MSSFHLLQPAFEYCSKEHLSQQKGLVWHLEKGYHVPLDEFVALPCNGGIIHISANLSKQSW